MKVYQATFQLHCVAENSSEARSQIREALEDKLTAEGKKAFEIHSEFAVTNLILPIDFQEKKDD